MTDGKSSWFPIRFTGKPDSRKTEVDNIRVKLVETEGELEGAINVRMRVFVVEQQIPAEVELDEADAVATHAVAFAGGHIVGTGRLLIVEGDPGGTCRIGRMAVDREWRRHGVGGKVLQYLEEQGKAQGYTHCLLHAQEYIKTFYASNGYRERGEVFLEEGIPHIEMVKEL